MWVRGPEIGKYSKDVSTKVQFLGKPTDYEKWEAAGRTTWSKFYGRIGDCDEAAGKALADKVFAASQAK